MIELRHLRYFIAVAEELNFRRAAERVHIDQTPLARTIRDLEDRLGLRLFVREPRKLHLTPAGTKLLKEARKVFTRVERTFRVVRETDARFRAPLRIGIADGIAQPRLVECFVRWRKLAPSIPLELTEMRALELVAALDREELDAGFSFGLPDNETIEQRPAWNYPAMALLPRDHELASRTVLSLQELLAFPLLSLNAARHPGLSKQILAIAQKHSVTLTVAGEALSLTGYVTRVAAGLAVGLADAGHLATICRSDLAVVALSEDEKLTTFVLHKRQRFGLTDDLKLFIANAETC
jgi:DNA-binding transcriptional LysR family regulator